MKRKPRQDLASLKKLENKILRASEGNMAQFEWTISEGRTFSKAQKSLKRFCKAPAIPPTVRNNTRTSTDKRCFNDNFVSVFDKSPENHAISFEPGVLSRVTKYQSQISGIMSQLKVNKSTGHDKIGNLVLKECYQNLNKSMTLILQTCLNKGLFPDACKNS